MSEPTERAATVRDATAPETARDTTQDIPLVSADSHVEEPKELWLERLPPRLRDRAPREVERRDGVKVLVIEGQNLGWLNKGSAHAGEAEADVDRRLRDLDLDGIRGEVVYPSTGLFLWGIPDRELGAACCRVYNEWLAETLACRSARFCCPALIPIWHLDEAVEEMRHAKSIGLRAAMLPMVAQPHYNSPIYDRLWRAAIDLDLPITMHQGTGHDMIHYTGPGSAAVNYSTTQSFAARTLGLLVMSGVLERFPTLHFTLVECGGGWLAWLMQSLDETYHDHAGWISPKLGEAPSFYVRRQAHVTFQDDPVAVHNRRFTGLTPLLWGSDYPHPEGTFPRSREAIARVFAGVPADEIGQMVGGTAAKLFGFEGLAGRREG